MFHKTDLKTAEILRFKPLDRASQIWYNEDRMEHYTAREVAEMLKVHERTISRWIKDGRLPAIRLGNRYRISRQDLEKFLQDRRTNRLD